MFIDRQQQSFEEKCYLQGANGLGESYSPKVHAQMSVKQK